MIDLPDIESAGLQKHIQDSYVITYSKSNNNFK